MRKREQEIMDETRVEMEALSVQTEAIALLWHLKQNPISKEELRDISIQAGTSFEDLTPKQTLDVAIWIIRENWVDIRTKMLKYIVDEVEHGNKVVGYD